MSRIHREAVRKGNDGKGLMVKRLIGNVLLFGLVGSSEKYWYARFFSPRLLNLYGHNV